MKDFKPDGHGNWLMLSTIYCSKKVDMLLTKLDSDFNVLWHKYYKHPSMKYIASKILVEDDGYILAGGAQSLGIITKHHIYQALIYKTDTAGNTLWTYHTPGNVLTGYIRDIIKTQDEDYVFCGMGAGVER